MSIGTGIVDIQELDFSQAEKEITVNTGFYKMWWVGRATVKDRDLTSPPGSPSVEAAYLIATGSTGAWAGHDGDIAYYFGSCWHFFTPWEGMQIWIDDENLFSTYTGTAWVDMAYGVDGTTVEISSSLLQLKNDGITNAKISASAAIDAAKIHDGTVSNTEFGCLNGIASNIQTQIDAKVTGPVSATDHAVVRFDGTNGKLIQNSGPTINDSGELAMGGQKIVGLAAATASGDAVRYDEFSAIDGVKVSKLYASDGDPVAVDTDSVGNVGIGTSAFGTNAVKVLSIGSGTAPTTSPSDAAQIWVEDQAPGNACIHIRTENGSILKLHKESHISDPSGGGTQDAEARTAIAAIIDALEAMGLLATS